MKIWKNITSKLSGCSGVKRPSDVFYQLRLPTTMKDLCQILKEFHQIIILFFFFKEKAIGLKNRKF